MARQVNKPTKKEVDNFLGELEDQDGPTSSIEPGEAAELTFSDVSPDRFRGNRSFFKFDADGTSLTFIVEKLVSADEAEASPDNAPMFEGIYAKTHPEGESVVISNYHQIVSFLEAEGPEAWSGKVYRATRKREKALKGGRTVIEFRMQEALLS